MMNEYDIVTESSRKSHIMIDQDAEHMIEFSPDELYEEVNLQRQQLLQRNEKHFYQQSIGAQSIDDKQWQQHQYQQMKTPYYQSLFSPSHQPVFRTPQYKIECAKRRANQQVQYSEDDDYNGQNQQEYEEHDNDQEFVGRDSDAYQRGMLQKQQQNGIILVKSVNGSGWQQMINNKRPQHASSNIDNTSLKPIVLKRYGPQSNTGHHRFHKNKQRNQRHGPYTNDQQYNSDDMNSDQFKSYDGRILRITKDGQKLFLYENGDMIPEQDFNAGNGSTKSYPLCEMYTPMKSENIVIRERTQVTTNLCGCGVMFQENEDDCSENFVISTKSGNDSENMDPNRYFQQEQYYDYKKGKGGLGQRNIYRQQRAHEVQSQKSSCSIF